MMPVFERQHESFLLLKKEAFGYRFSTFIINHPPPHPDSSRWYLKVVMTSCFVVRFGYIPGNGQLCHLKVGCVWMSPGL